MATEPPSPEGMSTAKIGSFDAFAFWMASKMTPFTSPRKPVPKIPSRMIPRLGNSWMIFPENFCACMLQRGVHSYRANKGIDTTS
jgi:hypothetical protein